MRRTLIPALLLALLAIVLAAGCGGGGSENTADTEPATTETLDRTATETETTATETEATETEATDTDADVDEFASSKNCREFAQLTATLERAFSGADTDLERTKKLLDAYAEKAPEEIRDDFRVYADYWSKIVEALRGVDLQAGQPPSPEVLQRLQQVQTEIDPMRLQQAGQNIANWAQRNCR
jgi:hypothetical protein